MRIELGIAAKIGRTGNENSPTDFCNMLCRRVWPTDKASNCALNRVVP